MNQAFFTRLPRIASLAALALVVAAMAASASAGPITFSITNESAPINGTTGGTGSFDIVVSQPGGGNSVFQYQFDLFVQPGATNISFVGNGGTVPSPAGTSSIEFTTAPYVFAGNSGNSGASDVLVFPGPSNGNEVSFTDEANTNAGAAVLSSTLLAMANVVFTVPAGTPAGNYPLVFNQDDLSTDPFADWVNTVSVTDTSETSPGLAINGFIHVTPEPSSVVMLLVGAVGLIGIGVRRARRA